MEFVEEEFYEDKSRRNLKIFNTFSHFLVELLAAYHKQDLASLFLRLLKSLEINIFQFLTERRYS